MNTALSPIAIAPSAMLRDFHTHIDRLMNSAFGSTLPGWDISGAATVFPAFNAWESDEAYTLEAELPGFTMDNLEITLLGDELTVRGQFPDRNHDGAAVLRRERRHGAFSRTVSLPGEVEADKVKATLINGVLTINLPKAAAAKPRRIKVSPD